MEEEKNVEKKSCKKAIFIIAIIVSFLIGALLMFILSATDVFCPGSIVAKANGEFCTTSDIYKSIISYMGGGDDIAISFLLDSIDYKVLSKKYTLDEAAKKEIDNYIQSYVYYYGLSEDYARSFLTLSKLRSLYYTDYLSKFISDDQVNSYYENTVIGDIECEHILVSPEDENFTDEQALALANEIISKLNSGTSFEDVSAEYENSEKYSNYIKHEQFTCQTVNSSSNLADVDYSLFSTLESDFVTGLLSLENNTYSASPVKTSYGYHIIYRKNQEDKDILENLKPEILKTLAQDSAVTNNDNTLYEILIDLRKENGFKIYDKELKVAYEEYCKSLSLDETSPNNEEEVYDEVENSETVDNTTNNTVQ